MRKAPNTTTLGRGPSASMDLPELDADSVQTSQRSLAVGPPSFGVAVLGPNDLLADGLGDRSCAASLPVPDGHELSGGAADLTDREFCFFSLDWPARTRRGTGG